MTRERKKNDRRSRIIEAAEALIRETGAIEFTMNALAERAGFSTPTTYNLIGSKATVLYILLNRYQDRLDEAVDLRSSSDDPFEEVIRASDIAVSIYSEEAIFLRPLMRFLLGIPDVVHRPAFMARGYRYWLRALEGLTEKGYLEGDVGIDEFARDMLIYFSGLIDFWVHGELNEEQFRLQARVGVIMRLMAVADRPKKKKLGRYLRNLRLELLPLFADSPE